MTCCTGGAVSPGSLKGFPDMIFVIRFMQNDKFMLVCNQDRTPMTFVSETEASKMAWRFEDAFGEIHWVESRLI